MESNMANELKVTKNDFATLIDMNINSALYEFNGIMIDCVENQFGQNQPSDFNLTGISREQYILYLLGHIALNPSKENNIDLLQRIYVYDKDAGGSHGSSPNFTPEGARIFLQKLIKSARIEAKERNYNSKGYGLRNRNVYLVHGVRGVGKTIFFNHLFAEHNVFLDTNKCIWVRINMIDSFGGRKLDIQEWVLSKLSLVVYRYFNKFSKIPTIPVSEEKHLDVHERLVKYVLKKNVEELRIFLHTKISLMERIFQNEKTVKLKEDMVPLEIGLEISEILIEKKYCFIFVIDGLDRLDLSPRYKEKFDHVLHELNQLINTDTTLGGTFLIVCRTESLKEVKERLSQRRTRENNVILNISEISYSPFAKIIKERFKFIEESVDSIGRANKWPLYDWPLHFKNFTKYLFNEYDAKDFDEFNDKMFEIFKKNNRSKIQLVQLTYLDYLRNIKYNKQYELVERMCKGGLRFPVAPTYSTDKDGI